MHIIRTAEALARAMAQPHDPQLKCLLQAQADRLAEYEDNDPSELALFAIVQAGDSLDRINHALGWSLLTTNGDFAKLVELIDRQGSWYEVTFILSDDGYGLVLFVPIDPSTDQKLLAACKRTLIEAHQPS